MIKLQHLCFQEKVGTSIATMRRTSRRNVATATALSVALVVQLLLLPSEAFKQSVTLYPNVIASVTSDRAHQILSVRGGDNHDFSSSTLDVEIDVEEIESSDEDEEDEEEEDVEDKLNPKLARAVQSSKVKAKAVKAATQSAKTAIQSTLLASKPQAKKEKTGLAKLFQLPYIVKACLNPFIFFQMTKEYWWSLFNHKYGEATRV
jgi:hypothetical protein